MADIVVTEADGLRMLFFGSTWCQGAMRLDDPDRLELAYAERMFGWLLFHDLDRLAGQHLVTLGLGAGSLTRFAHHVLGMSATAVDIEAGVIAACRTYFALPRDGERLRLVHGDGALYVADPRHAHSVDVLQVDAYDAAVERPALDSDAFYADVRRALRDGGSVVTNLIGRGLDVSACVARLRGGLRPTAVWQFPPTQAGNVVVVAHCGEVPQEALLVERAEAIEERWELPAREWLAVARRSA